MHGTNATKYRPNLTGAFGVYTAIDPDLTAVVKQIAIETQAATRQLPPINVPLSNQSPNPIPCIIFGP
jgi:hypothetical protein